MNADLLHGVTASQKATSYCSLMGKEGPMNMPSSVLFPFEYQRAWILPRAAKDIAKNSEGKKAERTGIV